jgi:hypothetical protein
MTKFHTLHEAGTLNPLQYILNDGFISKVGHFSGICINPKDKGVGLHKPIRIDVACENCTFAGIGDIREISWRLRHTKGFLRRAEG